jgi:hypothetical protein
MSNRWLPAELANTLRPEGERGVHRTEQERKAYLLIMGSTSITGSIALIYIINANYKWKKEHNIKPQR